MMDSEASNGYLAHQEHLLIIDDALGHRAIVLEEDQYSVGRDHHNAIRLEGPSISRWHAVLQRIPQPDHGSIYRVKDGDDQGHPSRNGVRVNGAFTLGRDLKSGDWIEFGLGARARYVVRHALKTYYPAIPSIVPIAKC